MGTNTCEMPVGRLLEIRVDGGFRSVDDVRGMVDLIGAHLGRLPPTRNVVVAADWRNCPIMSPAASEHAVGMMTRNNPRVERSAALVSDSSPTAVLQFVRLVRNTGHPLRRIF